MQLVIVFSIPKLLEVINGMVILNFSCNRWSIGGF